MDALRWGGQVNIKAGRIQIILNQTYEKYGELSLEHLREAGDEEAKQELMAFEGFGSKTASCVLLYCLKRESFAAANDVVSGNKSTSKLNIP